MDIHTNELSRIDRMCRSFTFKDILVIIFFLSCCGLLAGVVIPLADIIGDATANFINSFIIR